MARLEKSVRVSRHAERAKLLRELEQSMASQRRGKAKGMRKEVGSAKKERAERLKDAGQRCSSNKKKARTEGGKEYREARERDRERDKQEREAFRAQQKQRRLDRKAARIQAKEDKIKAALAECQRERQAIEEETGTLIAEREAKLKAQLEDIRVYREVDRRNASIKKDRRQARPSAKERRAESDDEVLQNIDRSLHPLFHRVKSIIKGNPRMSRTEAFLQYVHDHPDEAIPRWEATYTDDYFAREYARHLAREHEAPALAEAGEREEPPPAPAPEKVPKAARKRGGRRRAVQEAQPAAVAPAALRSLSAAEGSPTFAPAVPPRPAASVLPASGPAPKDEEIISIQGVRAERLRSPTSPEIEELIERAAIQDIYYIVWRVGDLEVLSMQGRIYIARPGAPLVSIPHQPDVSTRAAVEAWLAKEQPRRPFVPARAPEVETARALPEATEERPAGVQVEERDGVVRILFPGKPRVELRERLKRARFRWNPPAWEARATNEARAMAAEVARDAAGPAPELTAYEEKRLARVERMKTKAERTKQEAEATIERAREMGKVIPFGEPIHVGHHSERRDRNYRAKIHRTYDKGFKMLGEAETLEHRAARAERNTAISSDDPDAIEKLEAKLAALEDVRALLPRAREVLKKARSPEAARPKLIALGLDEGYAARLTPGPPLQRSAASTVKQNLDGEIQRVRRRIEDLKARAARGPKAPEVFGDARIEEEDNRVRIFFPGKPDETTRKALRSRGFLWAPSVGAWQRKATESAWYWARSILRSRASTQAAVQAAPARVEVAEPEPELEPWEEEPPPEAFADEQEEPEYEEEDPPTPEPIQPRRGTYPGTAWSTERQVSIFGGAAPAPPSELVLTQPPVEPEQRRARPGPRTRPEQEGPRRNLAFEDLKPWEMSAWERTPSLFGEQGPVPPAQPGEQRAPKQKRMPF